MHGALFALHCSFASDFIRSVSDGIIMQVVQWVGRRSFPAQLTPSPTPTTGEMGPTQRSATAQTRRLINCLLCVCVCMCPGTRPRCTCTANGTLHKHGLKCQLTRKWPACRRRRHPSYNSSRTSNIILDNVAHSLYGICIWYCAEIEWRTCACRELHVCGFTGAVGTPGLLSSVLVLRWRLIIFEFHLKIHRFYGEYVSI